MHTGKYDNAYQRSDKMHRKKEKIRHKTNTKNYLFVF